MSMSYQEQVRAATKPQVIMLKVSHHRMINFNYLVVDPVSRLAVIVDPAWELDKINAAIHQAGVDLVGVLLTHSHGDHTHLAQTVAQSYHCPIWMSQREIEYAGYHAAQLIPIDESPLLVGNMKIQPVLTPGHTPGSTCYLIDKNIFTGDVLFAEGCGLCPDIVAAHDMYSSLERLKAIMAMDTRVFPGHSYGKVPGQYFSTLLKENIYLQFPDKSSFAAFRLRKRQSSARVFDFK
ncbi:MBL fold metallo-hydrolase [Pseudoalteromonas sp. J010]|uniref:MBL fold metallo-hydrolase n=1 Tax=Pseudoalteromonas sp. J010 TaxID=998465 RepID=UPI000F64A075|nr:MBL fold metallo-hydrolase [Pseudoalteromonas sp. J010]RRS10443.1 MBL fold metallo-hydrolase [Pseudoalteromonas sp. J010]